MSLKSEERFTEVHVALKLKPLNKMDFDKLIASMLSDERLAKIERLVAGRSRSRQHSRKTGFVFTLWKHELEGELPRGFINAALKKGKWMFSSMDLWMWEPGFRSVCPLGLDGALDFIIFSAQLRSSRVLNEKEHIPYYLRQVGLLTILFMCGCFGPAEYTRFRIHDALLTRLSNDDDMERSLSAFASGMATSAMILGLASLQSLVLTDELSRGSSPREGVGISHAIAEGLIEPKKGSVTGWTRVIDLEVESVSE
ncbi:muts domain V-domain-containing protein [Mycena maculata]|uniref:Muts domain V-domain-containing protein n=1 Tax=Mycena maculata TaxID=230809 RepID=A0AAD7H6F5_9AGAR|nr:muts domain V-domain-containing protein [Mycena maculata]